MFDFFLYSDTNTFVVKHACFEAKTKSVLMYAGIEKKISSIYLRNNNKNCFVFNKILCIFKPKHIAFKIFFLNPICIL